MHRGTSSGVRFGVALAACVAAFVFLPTVSAQFVREFDGHNNNLTHPDWGRADEALVRMTPMGYGDGLSTPAGATRPSPRAISNLVCAQVGSIPNSSDVTDFVWQWGQFLDHDLDLTEGAAPAEAFDIVVPNGDPFFDPFATGSVVIPLNRSAHDGMLPRQQVNQITSYIDGSVVYGADTLRANALRLFNGTGALATSAGGLLPYNTAGLPNAGGSGPELFLAGDIRSNEQVGLTAMHTLFVREHNFWCGILSSILPGWEEVNYHLARVIVAAEIQVITYQEFLPALLGPNALPPYTGYNPNVDASIANEFSTAAYRFGHSMLSPVLKRLDANLQTIPEGDLPLKDAFFDPTLLPNEGGIDPLLRGLASQRPQEVDVHVVDAIRNFLFGPPGAGGFDLASLNIQRGRDHGLPSYNQARVSYGLPPVVAYSQITSDLSLQLVLASVYPNLNDIDLWVGGLAEDHVPGALLGETFHAILVDQFTRLRDGDRFWIDNYVLEPALSFLHQQKLSDIIRRNTGIGNEIQDDVFLFPTP